MAQTPWVHSVWLAVSLAREEFEGNPYWSINTPKVSLIGWIFFSSTTTSLRDLNFHSIVADRTSNFWNVDHISCQDPKADEEKKLTLFLQEFWSFVYYRCHMCSVASTNLVLCVKVVLSEVVQWKYVHNYENTQSNILYVCHYLCNDLKKLHTLLWTLENHLYWNKGG